MSNSLVALLGALASLFAIVATISYVSARVIASRVLPVATCLDCGSSAPVYVVDGSVEVICDQCGVINSIRPDVSEPVEYVEPVGAYCEDYPCCGHTDGLGCNWVSPNESQPCDVCFKARKSSPYHTMWAGDCPTEREQREVREEAEARKDVPAGKVCNCGDSATHQWNDGEFYTCKSCWDDDRFQAEQHDYEYSLYGDGYEY